MGAFSKSTETVNCENHKMAKVNLREINNALNEANQLEYELSLDEQCRELDEFEYQDDWRHELEPEYDKFDDLHYPDDHFGDSHWYDDPAFDDLFDGDF